MRCKLTLLSRSHDHMQARVPLASTVSRLACRFKGPSEIINGVLIISTVTQYYLNLTGSMFV